MGSVVLGWGSNQYGQLGLGEELWDVDQTRPVRIPVEGRGSKVFAGGSHSFAVSSDGRLLAWGNNDEGQLGIDRRKNVALAPERVDDMPGVVKIAAGFKHTLVLMETGAVRSFGSNSHGQVGSPYTLRALPNCTDIAAGVRHSLAVTALGEVFAWGDNRHGQCGDAAGRASKVGPIKLAVGAKARAVGAGLRFSIVLDERGGLRVFGKLEELGYKSVKDAEPLTEISCGWFHVAAITETKQCVAWGKNAYGQLAVSVPSGSGAAVGVSCGSEHTAVRFDTGQLNVVGWNEHGQSTSELDECSATEGSRSRLFYTQVASGGSHVLAVAHKA